MTNDSPTSTTRGAYTCLKVIGAGAFGKVFQAKHTSTGTIVALKVIDLENSDHEDIALIQKEVAVLSQLSNVPNITKYYGSFLDGSEVCIAMEYASAGSVYDLMQTLPSHSLEEKPAAFIIREILVALVALHAAPVIHRDIKCANILISKTGSVLLCDFGVAALLQGANNRRDTWIGSPYWMAPEIVSGASSYDVKVDIWSLGVTLYEMIKGAPPLAHLRPEDALKRIGKSQPPRLGEEDSSTLLRTFLASCLKETPDERPSADVLVKDKWLAKLKVANSVLRDLIPSYRQSLPGLDSQGEQFSESFVRPESWTFSNEDPEDSEDFGERESEFDSSTVHPISTTPLPRSLKGLFNEVEHVNVNAPTMLSNSFLPDDGSNYSRSRRLPSPIPPMAPSPYPPSPTLPSSTTPVYLSRSAPMAPSPIPDPTPPSSHPTTPPSSHTTLIHLTAATGLEKQTSSSGSTASTPSTLTPTSTDINPQSFRRTPISVSPSASSSETSSSEGDSHQQVPPIPPPRLFQPVLPHLTQVSINSNHESTTSPFSPSSSSSSSKSSHRMHTITGKTMRRDNPSTWKFPSTPFNISNGRLPELPSLGLGLAPAPSPTLAHQLGMPDLLPPSPLPLGYTVQSKTSTPTSTTDDLGHPAILQHTFISSHTPPRPINYPALISDPNLTTKELERVVQDLTGLLQDMYEGLNDILGDDPIDE